MDVIAHGFWGGALFFKQGGKKFATAALVGMAPDLLSFGVYHVMHPGWLGLRLAGKISEPPALSQLPPYVFHAYNVTHSLVVWAVGFFLFWWLIKKVLWLTAAWLLHILCDIPTHTTSYFPTPFLWPFATPFVNGIPWSTPWFMAANYATIFVVYCFVFLYFRRQTS